jgi:hypothetical protein
MESRIEWPDGKAKQYTRKKGREDSRADQADVDESRTRTRRREESTIDWPQNSRRRGLNLAGAQMMSIPIHETTNNVTAFGSC